MAVGQAKAMIKLFGKGKVDTSIIDKVVNGGPEAFLNNLTAGGGPTGCR